MSLTPHDLRAIAALFNTKFEEKVIPELRALDYKIDAVYNELTRRADAIDKNIEDTQTAVARVENAMAAEASRTDRHGVAIASINRELGLL